MMKCTMPIEAQLQQIADLRAGWLDGEGKAISTITLLAAGTRLREHMATVGVLPFLYPCEDGGISVEWEEDGGGHFKIEPIDPPLTAEEGARIREHLRGDTDDEEWRFAANSRHGVCFSGHERLTLKNDPSPMIACRDCGRWWTLLPAGVEAVYCDSTHHAYPNMLDNRAWAGGIANSRVRMDRTK